MTDTHRMTEKGPELPVHFSEGATMTTQEQSSKKEKRPRGTNWLPDALKALLQVGILRREKIRGCEAVGDVRNETHKELSDAVTATGQTKSIQECLNKLRTYPSEVKYKYLQISRETINQTGAGLERPVKDLNPSENEALALAFLGIEKVAGIVGGRKTSLKPSKEFDYVAERKKERESRADLEKKLAAVTKEAKVEARKKYGSQSQSDSYTDDDADMDSLVDGSKGGGKKRFTRSKIPIQNPSAGTLNRIVETIERIEDRLIRMEGKTDNLQDIVSDVKRDLQRAKHGETDDMEGDDESLATIELPAPKTKPPEVQRIPFIEIKNAIEEFLRDATEDDWDEIIVVSITRNLQQKAMRERVYLKVIDNLSQDDIDMIQEFFISHLPEYVKESINAKSHYHVYTAVACDLVSYGRFSAYIKDADVLAAANQCRVIDNPPEPKKDLGAGDARAVSNPPGDETDFTLDPKNHVQASPTSSTAGDEELLSIMKGKDRDSTPCKTGPKVNVEDKSNPESVAGTSQVKNTATVNAVQTKTKKGPKKGFKVPIPRKDGNSDTEPPTAAKRPKRGRPKKN